MFTFEIDSENALLGCTLGTLGPTVELVKEKGNFVHSRWRRAWRQSSCQSCHFDMDGGDSAVGTNALARDALASSSGMLVPLQSGRTVHPSLES